MHRGARVRRGVRLWHRGGRPRAHDGSDGDCGRFVPGAGDRSGWSISVGAAASISSAAVPVRPRSCSSPGPGRRRQLELHGRPHRSDDPARPHRARRTPRHREVHQSMCLRPSRHGADGRHREPIDRRDATDHCAGRRGRSSCLADGRRVGGTPCAGRTLLGRNDRVAYARTYPDDVSGLVLVDPGSQYLQSTLPPAVWDQWMRDIETNGRNHPGAETPDYPATLAALETMPPLPAMPAAVLTSDEPFDYLGIGDADTYWPQWLDAAALLSTASMPPTSRRPAAVTSSRTRIPPSWSSRSAP